MVRLTHSFLLAAGILLASGLVLFGWPTLVAGGLCAAAALLLEAVLRTLTGRRDAGWVRRALLTGLLVACTLPPLAGWQVSLLAAAAAVLLGRAVVGASGKYLWNPVALGRIAVQLLFFSAVTPAQWPVLARGELVWGNLSRAAPLSPLVAWSRAVPAAPGDAWLVDRPADVLCEPAMMQGPDPAAALGRLVRDGLPPWEQTLWGTAGGAIGEACVAACLLAGLLLLRSGAARVSYLLVALAAAALCAAVLPLAVSTPSGTARLWLPAAVFWDGMPVGLAYVMYQLTAGELPLVLLVIAPDRRSSPATPLGLAVFGAVLASVAMVLRIVVGIPAAAYWGLLIANTLVPLLDRPGGPSFAQRRVGSR